MEIEQLRAKAKELGFRQAANMSEETLIAKIKEAEEEPKIIISQQGLDLLDFFDVKLEFVESVREANGWDKMEYSSLRKAFKCYVGGEAIGMVNLEDILVKGGAR